MKVTLCKYLFLLCFLIGSHCIWAQSKSPISTTSPSPLDQDTITGDSVRNSLIMSSDDAIYSFDQNGNEWDTLSGHVVLIQDSVLMSCDYAIVENQINASTKGNVIIVQNDSIYIYSDKLDYNGIDKIAVLTGEVILDNGGRRLNTTDLIYDVNTKVGRFLDGGTLIDQHSTLISKEGVYDVKNKVALFRYNVEYQDTSRVIYTDSLIYDLERKQIRIISPTRIVQNDGTEIYSESGIYSTAQDRGVLSQNVQVSSDNRIITSGILEYDGKNSFYKMYIDPVINDDGAIAKGDTIIYQSDIDYLQLIGNATYKSDDRNIASEVINYDNKTNTYSTRGRSTVYDGTSQLLASSIDKLDSGITLATGSVILVDTAAHSTIVCDAIMSIDSLDRSYAYNLDGGQPLLIYELAQEDTLLLLADTLLSYSIDSADAFLAYHNIKIKKENVLGIADSLSFLSLDSIFILYNDPILWVDSTQLSADTIKIYMKSNAIEKIELIKDAFIIENGYPDQFNQINGALITCTFDGNFIKNAYVNGNAQMIFHILDDNKELVGINKALSSTMTFYFDNNEIDEIRFYKNPEYTTYEYKPDLDLTQFRLEGFQWSIEKKPDILNFTVRITNAIVGQQ